MAINWSVLVKPGSTELSARGILALGVVQGWSAVVLLAIDSGVGDVLGGLMAVTAVALILVGAVALGVQLGREESRR